MRRIRWCHPFRLIFSGCVAIIVCVIPCRDFSPVNQHLKLQLETPSWWFPDLFYTPIPMVRSILPYLHPLARYCQNNFRFSHNFSRSAHHSLRFSKWLRSPVTRRPIQYVAEYSQIKWVTGRLACQLGSFCG